MLPSRRPPAAPARLLVALGAVMVLGTACSSDTSDTPAQSTPDSAAPSSAPPAAAAPSAAPSAAAPAAPSAAAASAAKVTIVGFEYEMPDGVAPGTELSITNEDRQAHTFTVEGGESLTIAGGETKTMAAPAEPGTYRITCAFHGNMTAELVVT